MAPGDSGEFPVRVHNIGFDGRGPMVGLYIRLPHRFTLAFSDPKINDAIYFHTEQQNMKQEVVVFVLNLCGGLALLPPQIDRRLSFCA